MKNNTKYFLFGLSLLCVCMIGITTIKGSILNPLRTAVGYVLGADPVRREPGWAAASTMN